MEKAMFYRLFYEKFAVRLGTYLVLVLGLVVSFFLLLNHGLKVYAPTRDSIFYEYDDRELQGSSVSSGEVEKEALDVHFELGGQSQFPYAGVSFPIETNGLGSFNSLEIKMSVPKEMKVAVLLNEQYWNPTQNKIESNQHLEYVLHCIPGKKDYIIPFSSFIIPSWWIKEHPQKAASGTRWDKLTSVSLQNDPVLAPGKEQEFSVMEIKFARRYPILLYAAISFVGLIVLGELFWHKKKQKIDIRFVPTDTGKFTKEDPWKKIEAYVASNYRKDFDLEAIAFETGIAKNKVSSMIKENTTMNFRQYVNAIRINESERLMRDTPLSISEIGYEVGFASPTHFNRVFREFRGMAPSEFKKSKTY